LIKPSSRCSLVVLAVSAVLLTPSTQACDDETPASAKANETAPKLIVKKRAGPKASPKNATAQEPVPGSAGRVVTRDPETGELRAATAEEVNRLRASMRTTLAMPMVETVLPDGTVRLEPGERGLASSTLEKLPDGTLKPGCVTGRDPSRLAPAPAKPAAEEK
jgi:hypothetical protein